MQVEYARCMKASQRVRWDVDADVIRGRKFDCSQGFLPDSLSLAGSHDFLDGRGRMLLGQVQGRTYANMLGLMERFVGAKILVQAREHWFGDHVALESLVRFAEETLKHLRMFQRVEAMLSSAMPPGYLFLPEPSEAEWVVLSKANWAALALILAIELSVQSHSRQSAAPGVDISPLYRDIFHYHWLESTMHAVLVEIELARVDKMLSPSGRERAASEFVDLVIAVDALLRGQSGADVRYFLALLGPGLDRDEIARLKLGMLDAYRRQHVLSGLEHPRFSAVMARLAPSGQLSRLHAVQDNLRGERTCPAAGGNA